MFTPPVLLSEKDIPGASVEGRKPAELKKADLVFWLRCRGDPCKGFNVKTQLVKRYVTPFVNVECFAVECRSEHTKLHFFRQMSQTNASNVALMCY